jgi:hypothetical protein
LSIEKTDNVLTCERAGRCRTVYTSAKGAGRIRSSKRKAINASDYRHGGKTKIVETAAKKALFGSGYNGNTF